MGAKYTIDLVRHAESAWVEKADKMSVSVFGGRMNSVPLSDLGRRQAKAFGTYRRRERFQPTAFYASPAVRATQTHNLSLETFGGVGKYTLKTLDHFMELDWGAWEGQPRSLMAESQYAVRLSVRGFDFRPPGGESFRDVRSRALTGLVNALSSQPPGAHIVVYTHKNVIKSLVYRALGWTVEKTHAANVGLLSITQLTYENPDGFRLEFFNQPTVVVGN